MTFYLICMFGVSLVLTITVELVIAYLFGMRTGKDMLLTVLVNIFTNPPAVMCNWLCRLYLPDYRMIPAQLVIEAAVVAVETLIYCAFAKDRRWHIRNPVLLSLSANSCSWLLGLLI